MESHNGLIYIEKKKKSGKMITYMNGVHCVILSTFL